MLSMSVVLREGVCSSSVGGADVLRVRRCVQMERMEGPGGRSVKEAETTELERSLDEARDLEAMHFDR